MGTILASESVPPTEENCALDCDMKPLVIADLPALVSTVSRFSLHIDSQKWMSSGMESHVVADHGSSAYSYVNAGLLGPQKNFPCSRCGKSYDYKRNLWRHQKYECGKQPLFQCPFCPTKTSHKCHLMTHIRNIHHTQDY
ncbi:hypothetical protein PR048_000170 [Dryococelus australis]|uniref:C2H2-type domain-containing protein n=1 Tax=Dryococelus australis TaxID=614101 RepID=A0ABQ9IG45_9NEOP|nr:hypothetical protein PR048_000170 [Dryococelus australis]